MFKRKGIVLNVYHLMLYSYNHNGIDNNGTTNAYT